MRTEVDREAERIGGLLPAGPRVAILGSSAFHRAESPILCGELGRALAELPHLVLLTGGVPGVGEAVGRAFQRAIETQDAPGAVFHILPEGPDTWDYGRTHFTGTTMEHRREVLGRLARCFIVVEGGPGTEHECEVALSRSALVIPVGSSGGHARELYERAPRPAFVEALEWRILGVPNAASAEAVAVVMQTVRAWLGTAPDRD